MAFARRVIRLSSNPSLVIATRSVRSVGLRKFRFVFTQGLESMPLIPSNDFRMDEESRYKQVSRISAYLVAGDLDAPPSPLASNLGIAFQGSIILGLGFTFDDNAALKGRGCSLSNMERLTAKEPRYGSRIFPYLGRNGSWCRNTRGE